MDRAAEVQALKCWTIRAVVGGLLVAMVAALCVAVLAYGWPPRGGPGIIEPVRVGLVVAGGVGGAVALVVAYRRQRILERDEAGDRDRQKGLHDRYGAAAAQLGHEDPTVRLAGVYALANLADEWDDRRQQCVDVLCGHLRLPWLPTPDTEHPLAQTTIEQPVEGGGKRIYTYPDQTGEVEVRKTILRVIAEHLRDPTAAPDGPPRPGLWSDLDLDFTGATLPDADFDRTVISEQTRFVGATFTGKAWFDDATFTGDAWFVDATFTGGARFVGATFTGRALFDRVTFTKAAWFDEATFTEAASFNRSTFTGKASFERAAFTGEACFDRAAFTEARFHQAMFKEAADFTDATFTGDPSFLGTRFTGHARFYRATFSDDAFFDDASFTGGADFTSATFTRTANFTRAKFTEYVKFDNATFSEDAWFTEVTFTTARFTGTDFRHGVPPEVRPFLPGGEADAEQDPPSHAEEE